MIAQISIFTNDGLNWSLEINGTLIKDRFLTPYEAYKFFNFCSECWYRKVNVGIEV